MALVFQSEKWGRVSAAGAAFGVVFFGLLLSWIRLFGLPAYAGLVMLQTAWVVAGLHLGVTARRNLPGAWKLLAFPLALLAGEYLRGHLPLGGFTWGGLGYTQHDSIGLLRLAPYTGVWGLSFLVAGVNGLVAEAIGTFRRSAAKGSVWAVAAALAVLFPSLLPAADADGAQARLAMVQGNLPPAVTEDPREDDEIVLGNHAALTRTLERGGVSLVIWAESTLDVDPFAVPEFLATINETIAAVEAPLILGTSLDEDTTRFRNATLFFGVDGNLVATYSKMHLVPFGEFVPGRRFLEPLVPEIQRVPRDGIPGEEPVVFSLPEGEFASVICFESTFPGLVRKFVQQGARLLVVSTNNSSFERTPASAQHLTFSQVRAAEHRMWVAHTALTGISAVVAPDGRVLERTGLFEGALLTPTVRFATRTTLYASLGDWFPAAAMGVMGFALLLPLVRLIRRRAN